MSKEAKEREASKAFMTLDEKIGMAKEKLKTMKERKAKALEWSINWDYTQKPSVPTAEFTSRWENAFKMVNGEIEALTAAKEEVVEGEEYRSTAFCCRVRMERRFEEASC